jgi:hypothetical protein
MDILIKGQGVLKPGKQADDMDFLGGGKLHSGKADKPVCLTVLQESRTIARGVVVCQGDSLKPVDKGHAGYICRGHVVVPARREAGVQMKIVE